MPRLISEIAIDLDKILKEGLSLNSVNARSLLDTLMSLHTNEVTKRRQGWLLTPKWYIVKFLRETEQGVRHPYKDVPDSGLGQAQRLMQDPLRKRYHALRDELEALLP